MLERVCRHVAFVLDYIYNVLETDELPEGRVLRIMDLKGLYMTDLGGEVRQVASDMALAVGQHYPERMYRYCGCSKALLVIHTF